MKVISITILLMIRPGKQFSRCWLLLITVSIFTDLLYISDDESDEDENETEAHEISELKTKHKKTGLPLIEIKVNSTEMKIPPAK